MRSVISLVIISTILLYGCNKSNVERPASAESTPVEALGGDAAPSSGCEVTEDKGGMLSVALPKGTVGNTYGDTSCDPEMSTKVVGEYLEQHTDVRAQFSTANAAGSIRSVYVVPVATKKRT